MKDRIILFSPGYWPEVRDILNRCLCQNTATFFHVAPSLEDWEQSHLPQGRLLYLDQEEQVQGWTALQPMEHRKEAEVSIYVNPNGNGKGLAPHSPPPFYPAPGIWALSFVAANIGKQFGQSAASSKTRVFFSANGSLIPI